ncbi:hypothetical protein [Streptacidiphilus jiangxiensis]|uniref:hypothetical protein n=1 Tax=Streptacidiphilus jiangxiensis TaxID=235985 RepID=UPI0005AA938D|nr:hypothetical protein [Streptacidiphilus jiangxiensis]
MDGFQPPARRWLGYYGEAPTPTSYFPLAPAHVLDTRYAVGAPKGQLDGGKVLRLKVLGVAGVPVGARTVLLSLTALNATANTAVTAFAENTARPAGAAVEAGRGLPATVRVEVPVGSDGYVDLYNQAGSMDLLADVQGYYA